MLIVLVLPMAVVESVSDTAGTAVLQTDPPAHLRGRVLGVWGSIGTVWSLGGPPVLGLLMELARSPRRPRHRRPAHRRRDRCGLPAPAAPGHDAGDAPHGGGRRGGAARPEHGRLSGGRGGVDRPGAQSGQVTQQPAAAAEDVGEPATPVAIPSRPCRQNRSSASSRDWQCRRASSSAGCAGCSLMLFGRAVTRADGDGPHPLRSSQPAPVAAGSASRTSQ
ncbi:predicted protein [Streptomyces viridochromogenes DSM 40736]|uniref:Predicted protein n=1 Tax=Streptomyces viridochromogenes (strain DSM 40736 / JCM 4977 / BCRC 1201 / Tue 494) TaxID=591159 RepID=D9XHY9_STRVT|nr:predicted protein [Streptomyces viridochromogenes DSM 40736]